MSYNTNINKKIGVTKICFKEINTFTLCGELS